MPCGVLAPDAVGQESQDTAEVRTPHRGDYATAQQEPLHATTRSACILLDARHNAQCGAGASGSHQGRGVRGVVVAWSRLVAHTVDDVGNSGGDSEWCSGKDACLDSDGGHEIKVEEVLREVRPLR